MGDWFATVAMLGLVLDRTDSGLAASGVFVIQTLPSFFLTPLAGPAADRFDRRKLMLVVSCGQSVAALGFLVASHGPLIAAFVAQGAIAALAAFFQPASQAALPNLVEEDDLPTATVVMTSTWGAMLAIGAALGGGFTILFGRDAAFVADSVSFAGAALLILLVRRPLQRAVTRTPTPVQPTAAGASTDLALDLDADVASPARRPFHPLRDTAEALRFASQRPTVLALLGSKVGFGLANGVVGMLALLATGKYDAGDVGTGFLLAGRGAGVLLGPLFARRLINGSLTHIFMACGCAALVFCLGYWVVAFAPVLALAVVAVLVAHLGGGTQWTLSTYGLQLTVPDHLRGRVFAADYALVTLTMTVSYLVSGALADARGPTLPTALLATIAGIWGVAYLVFTRTLRSGATPAAAADTTV